MDVTFFENQPYYSKTDIQGQDTPKNPQEYHFRHIPSTSSPFISSQQQQQQLGPSNSSSQQSQPSPNPSTNHYPSHLRTNELQVYSQRESNQEGIEQ